MSAGQIDALIGFLKCVVIGSVIAGIAYWIDRMEDKWKNGKR